MSRKHTLSAVVFCLFVSLSSPFLFGQATGSFSGTVTDNAGALVTAATVKITSQGTGLTRDTKTDQSGHYLVPLLPIGIYTIQVQAPGFSSVEQKDIRLQVDEQREFDFNLKPASVNTTVEVNATEVTVETSNPSLGQVITAEEVAELPLNGRNFVQLATLTPGTTQSTNPNSFFTNAASSEAATRGAFSLSVGGSREQSTDWLLDGNDNNQLDEGGIGIFSDIDAIQEFKVLTYNYSAEYGERAGPTVLVTTKSGTNQFHGSLFEFFRNTKLDARSYFATSVEKFNLNQFGGSFGGPIKKDKTFFFVDYQAKMQRHGIPFTGFVPTTGMTTADANGNYDFSGAPTVLSGKVLTNPYSGSPFACLPGTTTPEPVLANGSQAPGGTPCPIIPGSVVNPVGLKVMQLYPTPNALNAVGYNYINEPVRKLNEGTWDIRLDHNISSKDSVFGRFSYDQATNFVPGGSPTWTEQNAFGSNQYIDNHGRNAALSETHVFSANTINQVTVGYNRIFNHILSFGTGTCEAAIIGIPGADLGSKCDSITGYPASLNQSSKDCISCGMTSFLMSNYFAIGDRGYAPYQGGTNVYSVSDTLNLIRGRHNIRFGATFRANQMNVRNNAFQDGFVVENAGLTGDDAADLLLGGTGIFAAHDQTFLGGTVGRRWKLFRPFVQDEWRITNSLTLSLGVGWALATPQTEVQNRQANFDIQTLKWYVPKGSPTLDSCTVCVPTDGRVGIQFQKTAFEPRIGLAWRVMGSDKTVIRAGYGILHDSAWNQGGQGLWQNPPYYAEVDPCPSDFCFAFGSTLSGGFLVPAATPSSTPVTGGAVLSSPVNPASYTGTIQSMNRNFVQGMVQQFNLNVERQLPGNVVLTAGYAGTRSTHILVGQSNENLTSPSACDPTSPDYNPAYTIGCDFPSYPYAAPFQSVNANNSVGTARYDSLQIKAETKSTRHGLYALLGYTWSRTFDSGMPDGLGTNPGAIYYPLPGFNKLDWGLSQLNLNDNFTASILYDLPFGKGKHFGSSWSGATNAILGNWQLDVIEHATSGFPLFVVDSADESGVFFSYNGGTFQRPNQVGDPNKGGGGAGCPAQVHTIQHWFNPCAFAPARAGELGTAARAPVYGPRFVNTDFSIIKDFPLPFREGMNLQFRTEFFNLFNHPQFYLGGTGGSGEQDINASSTFGVINNTVNNARLIQFALKLRF
ncbi:MAG TPA: carboxypeptidase-like regulatory domain-containing protein [Candidatus Sulfotelmatobacter sp.]|nr:carboxypeptidase-like regulatory domain-containing protein [Candidatus Sulfotelmatobacter sp.]